MNMARHTSGPRSARRTVAILAGANALLALPLAGCGGDDGNGAPKKRAAAPTQAARQAVTVNIADFKFKPAAIAVKTGGTVTFVNGDKAPHTAQTDLNPKTAEFDTDTLKQGDRKAVKLEHPGKFKYFCAFHAFMKGTVEVVK